MKAIVDFDYVWGLMNCMRYARRQVLLLKAVKEKNIRWEDLLEIIRGSATVMQAQNSLMEKYGVPQYVARELLDRPLRYGDPADGIEEKMEYYTAAAQKLSSLIKREN